MSRRKDLDNYFDPIELERRVREQEAFVESLFQPIFWNGPTWKLDWLVQDLIPTGYLVMLAGAPKVGKTCFATALALAVANGLPFAGRPTRQGAVLWISAEESPRERQWLLDQSPLAEPSTPFYTCYQRLQIDDERSLMALGDWVSRTEAKLLVVDPFIACAGHALTDSWAARRSLQELKLFAELNKIAVLVLHHQKRDAKSYRRGRVADNDQLAATASMNIVLSSSVIPSLPPPLASQRGRAGVGASMNPLPPLGGSRRSRRAERGEHAGRGRGKEGELEPNPNGDPARRAIRQSSLTIRHSGPAPARLISLDCYGRGDFANQHIYLVSNDPLDYRPTHVEQTEEMKDCPRQAHSEQRVLKVLEKGPRGSKVIIQESHLNPGSVRNAITNLRRKGRIKMISIGKNQRIYKLVEPKTDRENHEQNHESPNLDRDGET